MIIYQYQNSSRMIFQFQWNSRPRIPTCLTADTISLDASINILVILIFSLSLSLSHLSPFFCSFISWKISSLAFIYIPRYKSTLVISISPRMIVPILYIFFLPPSCFLLLRRFSLHSWCFSRTRISLESEKSNPRKKKKKIERNILRDKFINSIVFFYLFFRIYLVVLSKFLSVRVYRVGDLEFVASAIIFFNVRETTVVEFIRSNM